MPVEFSFTNEVLKEVAKWGVPIVGAFIAVFSTPLLEKIKLRLNRADLRSKQFEEFAIDLSDFIFHAELLHEYWSNGLADTENISPAIEEYNAAITTLRKKEYVYLSWAKRYWKASDYLLFVGVVNTVKRVDVVVHLFNDGNVPPERITQLATENKSLATQAKTLLEAAP